LRLLHCRSAAQVHQTAAAAARDVEHPAICMICKKQTASSAGVCGDAPGAPEGHPPHQARSLAHTGARRAVCAAGQRTRPARAGEGGRVESVQSCCSLAPLLYAHRLESRFCPMHKVYYCIPPLRVVSEAQLCVVLCCVLCRRVSSTRCVTS
jgi:hypothetical protein